MGAATVTSGRLGALKCTATSRDAADAYTPSDASRGHVIYNLLGIQERQQCAIVDVLTTGLEEASDEEDLEEDVCILEELEGTAGLD